MYEKADTAYAPDCSAERDLQLKMQEQEDIMVRILLSLNMLIKAPWQKLYVIHSRHRHSSGKITQDVIRQEDHARNNLCKAKNESSKYLFHCEAADTAYNTGGLTIFLGFILLIAELAEAC